MKIQNLVNKIKKIRPRELIYPAISLALFAAILISVLNAASSLSKNINKAFGETPETTELLTLDRANYELVAKKLGIIKPAQTQTIFAPVTTAATTTTPTE